MHSTATRNTLQRPRPARHPHHLAQQCFQTTALSRHHVTLVAPVPHHLTRTPPLLLFVAVGRVCPSLCLSWRLSLFLCQQYIPPYAFLLATFFTCVDVMATRERCLANTVSASSAYHVHHLADTVTATRTATRTTTTSTSTPTMTRSSRS